MAKVNWSPEETELFLDLCLEEVNGGNRSNKTISKDGWVRIQMKWNAHFSQDRELDKFKNKWDSVRKEWKDFEQFLNKETEIEWDPVTGTIDASEEWWKRQKLAKTKFYKYKNAPFALYEKCTTLFKNTIATSSMACTPSRAMPTVDNVHTPNVSLGDEGSGSSYAGGPEDLPGGDTLVVHETPPISVRLPVTDTTPLTHPTPVTNAVCPTRGTKRSRGKGKVTDTSKPINLADGCGAYETKLSTSVNQRSHDWSIEDVIDAMMTLPGLDPNSRFFSDCLVWMDSEHNRRTFLKIPTPVMKLNFLRSMMKKSGWDGDGY
ncbi:L10-interacting MYB domain-containing protein-like [Iris pallida]|uniref:L10-interacting MYB domain-containing protein-like n=1 Tax=Iris pallida TaxID=29817 RepID=A0AAX6GFA8_IRIPA|nr:L10-interacting MYB domain-containing protein-like [Iris pallida]